MKPPTHIGDPMSSMSLMRLPFHLCRAGRDHLYLLGLRLAVLTVEGDCNDRRVYAEVTRVGQIAMLAAEDDEVEMADRSVGDDRDFRLQAPSADGLRVGPRDQVDLAAQEEGEARKTA